MCANEREDISNGISRGDSMSQIARSLIRSPSTVTREIKGNGGRGSYLIWPAPLKAQNKIKRPKVSKPSDKALRWQVTSRLEELWT
ncbi:helix-turn-helix domain-containing protein [Acidithrix ferrooxidans]|uniref:helix-turn-helix domain-containing protein n=1 Tax=Acidithrix ferrooxidans TaxID=1280514 RepID=UPI000696F3B0